MSRHPNTEQQLVEQRAIDPLAALGPQKRPRRLEPKPLAEATEWLERSWSFQRLDAPLAPPKFPLDKPLPFDVFN